MDWNCKWTETILGVVILIFALWPELLGAIVSTWIVVIAAALLIIHTFTCKNCQAPKSMPASRPKRRKR